MDYEKDIVEFMSDPKRSREIAEGRVIEIFNANKDTKN